AEKNSREKVTSTGNACAGSCVAEGSRRIGWVPGNLRMPGEAGAIAHSSSSSSATSSSSSSSRRSPFSSNSSSSSSSSSASSSSSSSSSSSRSSEMGFSATGWVCETSISHSHSGQLRISPSSTSSSSTSISAEHLGQRSTSPSSDLNFSRPSWKTQKPPTGVL